jgi:hypothetical protein
MIDVNITFEYRLPDGLDVVQFAATMDEEDGIPAETKEMISTGARICFSTCGKMYWVRDDRPGDSKLYKCRAGGFYYFDFLKTNPKSNKYRLDVDEDGYISRILIKYQDGSEKLHNFNLKHSMRTGVLLQDYPAYVEKIKDIRQSVKQQIEKATENAIETGMSLNVKPLVNGLSLINITMVVANTQDTIDHVKTFFPHCEIF